MHTAMCMESRKKRVRPAALMGATGHSLLKAHNFTITDAITGIKFLIDTGSVCSIIPASLVDRLEEVSSSSLSAVNGSIIQVIGHITKRVSLKLNRVFTWNFKVAHIRTAIIGINFLSHFELLLDAHLRCLWLFLSNPVPRPIGVDKSSECAHIAQSTNLFNLTSRYQFLAKEFPEVFAVSNYGRAVKHDTVHHIITHGPPVHSRVRRLSPERMIALRREIQHLLDLNIIEPANSPWASPVHLVPKGNTGRFRVTGDYRLLNNQTQSDRYPLPFLHDFVDHLHGATIFSNLDLFKGYHHIRIAEADKAKTAICTPIGSFQFRRMPMGLSSAAQTFQRLVDEVLRGLPFVFCYVDDVLIFSKSEAEHSDHLKAVFQRLSHYGLILNKDKCQFGLSEIQFLGHVITNEGIRPI